MQLNESEARAYRSEGYVLLKELFPPVVLAIFHGKLQKDLNLKGDPAFLSRTPLLTKPALEDEPARVADQVTRARGGGGSPRSRRAR